MLRLLELREKLSKLDDPIPFLEGFFAFAPVGLQVFTPDGHSILANQVTRDMFGEEPADYCLFNDKFLSESGALDILTAAFKEKKTVVLPPILFKGSAIEATFFPILSDRSDSGSVRYYCGIFLDATAEVKLREHKTNHETIWKTAEELNPIGNWISGLELTDEIVWSRMSYKIFGVEYGKRVTVQEFFNMIHPADQEALVLASQKSISEGAPYRVDHRIIRPDGQLRWIQERGEVLFDSQGRPERMLGVCRDVTEEKLAQEQLLITQARYQKLFDSSVMGVFLANTRGGIFDANDAFLKIIGYSREDLANGEIKWNTMTPPEYADLDALAVQALGQTGSCPAYRKEYIRKDGTRTPVMVGGALVHPTSDEVISFAFDLSEVRELEGRVLQSQKMEAIGRFAGGIAHDFNNILAIILLTAERALLKSPEELKASLKTIHDSAERGARLTSQILAFSRKQVFDFQEIDLNQVSADIKDMIRRMLSEDIDFELVVDKAPAWVRANKSQVEQCLMNLALNARDAMPSGGKLKITVKTETLSQVQLTKKNSSLPVGNYVTLKVEDTGVGMDHKTLTSIFEPFFTTKEKGRGSGLGLSTVFGIVKQLGGDLEVQSEINKGCCFTLYFPATGAANHTSTPELATTIKVESEGRTVLLVEDQVELRETIKGLMTNIGFKVLEANNGQEALTVFSQTKTRIDLIVTDVIMPEMSGPNLIQKIKQIDSGQQVSVLYMSGYAWNEIELAGIDKETSYFMQKPFSSKVFLDMVFQAVNKT